MAFTTIKPCYCGKLNERILNTDIEQNYDEYHCNKCNSLIHSCCLKTKRINKIHGDIFFEFVCSKCSTDKNEIFQRMSLPWLHVTYLALYNLTLNCPFKNGWFSWKDDICSYIKENWNLFFGEKKKVSKHSSWNGTISGILSTNSPKYFQSGSMCGRNGFWKLTKIVGPPKNFVTKGRRHVQPCDAKNIIEENVRRKSRKVCSLQLAMERKEKQNTCITSKRKRNRDSLIKLDHDEIKIEQDNLSSFSSDTYTSEKDICNLELPDKLFKDDTETDDDYVDPGSTNNFVENDTVYNSKCSKTISPTKNDIVKSTSIIKQENNFESNVAKCVPMTPYDEKRILSMLDDRSKKVDNLPVARRLRAKLRLRQIKRDRCLPIFDMDTIEASIKSKEKPSKSQSELHILDRYQINSDSINVRNEQTSFLCRLNGDDRIKRVKSSNGRFLKPYIFRNYTIRPAKLGILEELLKKFNNSSIYDEFSFSVDYRYFSREYLKDVNLLLRQFFWPDIDVSEALHHPENSVIALYKRLVIGCGFIISSVNPGEAYLPFIVTHPDWQNAGIGKFMLYQLIQSVPGQDVCLNVSATNTAMLLYQKFAFKVDKLILDFYDRYLPPDNQQCRHAFLLRLKK